MSGFDDSFTVTATMEGQSPQSGATSVKTNGSNVTKPAAAEARPSKVSISPNPSSAGSQRVEFKEP